MQFKSNWRKYPYKTYLVDFYKEPQYCRIRRKSKVLRPRLGFIENNGFYTDVYNVASRGTLVIL